MLANSRHIQGLIEDVNIAIIEPSNFGVRRDFEGIEQLAISIGEMGLLQPIVIRPAKNSFELVAGNRRLQAYKKLGLKKIPCHILEVSDKEAFEICLIENLHKRSLNPLEEAEAFKQYTSMQGWGSITELAKKIGKSQEYISKRIKLLELPHEIQREIIRRRIKPSIAEELAYVQDKQTQSSLAKLISQRHLTVRRIRKLREKDISESYNNIENNSPCVEKDKIVILLDKLSVILKMSLIRVSNLIEDAENDWIVKEFLMQQRYTIHGQIDTAIRYKKRHLAEPRKKGRT